jgi:hypothetical protein
MRWGAIIGGWLVATGIASMLYVAGLALGFSAIDANNADAAARSVGLGTAVWMILTWTVSLFLGGMFASWFDGRSDQTMGALHGVTVWGLSIAASGLLLALGLAQAQLAPLVTQSGAQGAMWVAFLSILLALAASGVGGWLGAGHIRRVHHLRRYEPVAPGPR